MPKIDPNHYSVVDQRPGPWRKALYWLLGTVGVCAMATGAILYADYRNDVDFFAEAEHEIGMDVDAGRTAYVAVIGSESGRGDRISIDEVEANVVNNTSQAEITFSICRSGTGDTVLRNPIKDCAELTPVAGANLAAGGSRDQIIMAVTPQRQGRVVVEDFDITYSQSGKHGTQTLGPDVTVMTQCELEGDKLAPGTPRSCL